MESILRQFVVHKQHGRSIRLNNHTGCVISRSILFPSLPTLVRDRTVISIYSRTHRTTNGFGVVVYEAGRCTGIVVLLKHVYDRIVDRIACPLRIEGRIAFNCYRRAGFFRQARIFIPSGKRIAGACRHCGGYGLGCAIRHCFASNIASAVRFISKLEILAGIVYVQFLSFSLPDDRSFGPFKDCVIIGIDGRRNVAVQDALDIMFSFDLAVSVAFQILKQIYKVIFRCILHIFDPDSILVIGKVTFIYCYRGRFGIINRSP